MQASLSLLLFLLFPYTRNRSEGVGEFFFCCYPDTHHFECKVKGWKMRTRMEGEKGRNGSSSLRSSSSRLLPLFSGPTIASFFSHFLSSRSFLPSTTLQLPSTSLSLSKVVDGIIITRSTWDVITELWWWWHLCEERRSENEKREMTEKIIWDFEERLFFFSSWVATYFDSTFSILLFVLSFLWDEFFLCSSSHWNRHKKRGPHNSHSPLSSHGTHIFFIPFKENDFRNKKILENISIAVHFITKILFLSFSILR